MALALLQFVAAAAAIVAAGTALTRFADRLAELTGLGRLLVGTVLVAGATSLPELLVDLHAVRLGRPDLAVGDLMGSSLFNLLILACLDLVHRSPGRMLSREAAAHALSGTMSIVLTASAALALFLAHRSPGFHFAGAGTGPWVIMAVYLLGIRLVHYDQRAAARASGIPAASQAAPGDRRAVLVALGGYFACGAAILVAAPWLASSAGKLADGTGLGNTFFGTVFVALCTSLPELVASAAAVRMGAFDLAVGNIFGSNSFNMILLLPLDLVHPGRLLQDASPVHMLTALATVVVTGVVVLGQLYRAETRIRFLEPDAVLVILLVLGALAGIYFGG